MNGLSKLSILDACFPIDNQSHGLAAKWLEWEVNKCGAEIVNPEQADVILVTCVDPRNARFIGRVKKKYAAPIIAGGPGALAPYSIGKQATAVIVGDGSEFISDLVKYGLDTAICRPEVWIDGESRNVVPKTGFPWNCPPIQGEDGVYRVWLGKGCKKHCAFCQTGWSTKFEENPNPEKLHASIKSLERQKKRFSYLTNDPGQHHFYRNLPAVEHGSFSLQYIKKKRSSKGETDQTRYRGRFRTFEKIYL